MGDHGDADGETGIARREAARAVDRIDDEQGLAVQPFRRIHAFLGEPAKVGRHGVEPVPQETVDAQVGLGHRRTARLLADLRLGLRAVTEKLHRDRAGFPRNRLDARQEGGEGGRVGQFSTRGRRSPSPVIAMARQGKKFRRREMRGPARPMKPLATI